MLIYTITLPPQIVEVALNTHPSNAPYPGGQPSCDR